MAAAGKRAKCAIQRSLPEGYAQVMQMRSPRQRRERLGNGKTGVYCREQRTGGLAARARIDGVKDG